MAQGRQLVLPVPGTGEPSGLVIDEDRPPLQHAQLVEALQLVLPIIMQPYMIHRFHATRPLAGNMTGVTTFQLDISNRTKGHNTVWECLEALTGLSALQIIGLQLRRDTLKQSPAATLVQQARQNTPNTAPQQQQYLLH